MEECTMSDQYKEWFIENYDEYVRSRTDGSELEKTRDALGHRFLDAIETGELAAPKPDMDFARNLFRSFVEPVRQTRRLSFRQQSEYLLDALQNPDDGIHIEPFLDRVYPLGSHDGRDKAFRYWTEDDFNYSVVERYRNAAAVMEAAKDFDDQVAQPWINTLRRSGVVMVEECFRAEQ